jgi:2-C-methyl-D-erythritol 4-phosphate cytidylyltransferase
MLQWSVEALLSVRAIERIVVALPAEALAEAPEGTVAVAGGAVRSASVREALRACPDGDPVVVHDAARPLAPARLFERALEQLARSGADAVIAAAPVSDTIKEVDAAGGHTVARTLERARLWAVQTPQVFRRATLERALDVPDDVLAEATDDAWLVERIGGRVKVVPFPADNIKVTSPLDLEIAERSLC